MDLIASGRACDIFAVDDDVVLRRERNGRSLEREASVMRHLTDHGFPCPRVHAAAGADLLLDRITGPTLAEHVLARPTDDRIDAAAALLADLHGRLHTVPAMPGNTGAILHLDLHPDNVILADPGPVVIDWTNADHGDPEEDLAMTWLILHPIQADLPAIQIFLDRFLRLVGRHRAISGLPAAGSRRLQDRNLDQTERDLVAGLIEAHADH